MTAPYITIPPEAFTAAELAYTEALSNGEDPIRAACLAMLKAWPGMWKHPYTKCVILPLTENSNAEG